MVHEITTKLVAFPRVLQAYYVGTWLRSTAHTAFTDTLTFLCLDNSMSAIEPKGYQNSMRPSDKVSF